MKKVELLSPAGNMEMLKYAVMYGADAVYLAGTRFGARKFANNFTDKELVNAIKFAHLYGVKVYVTINTLIFEEEVKDFLEYVKFIYKIGVDAVLVQDFGMLTLIREVIPELEVHASTQMHNNGENVLKLLSECGVTRAVLDREMSLDEIKKLPCSIEKEVFCHGALCVSYSGQCLISSMILNRSGNRGECAGLCRLAYKNGEDGDTKYFFSLKDLCTADFLDQIIDAGVDSLKIEGRMKSPLYVGYLTGLYRKLIDSYYDGSFKKITKEEEKNIKLLFNRELTCGFIGGASNNDIVNKESPNHIGIHLGSYKSSKKKIKITLDEELFQGDVIRFKDDDKGMTVNFLYDAKNRLINKAFAGDCVYVDNFLSVSKSGAVRKVSSIKLNEVINDLPKRKVGIFGSIYLEVGKNLKIRVSDGINEVSIDGDVVEASIRRPVSEEDVRKLIMKTGNTVYQFSNLEVIIDDNVFVNLRELNDLRRKVLEKLDDERIYRKRNLEFKSYTLDNLQKKQSDIKFDVVVETKEQLEVAKRYKCNIFSANEELWSEDGVIAKYGENLGEVEQKKYMISDLGSLVRIKDGDHVYSDYMLNVVNSYTARALIKRGVSVIGVSLEVKDDDFWDMIKNIDVNFLEVFLYGKFELMKMKFDPKCSKGIVDRFGNKYPLKRVNGMNYLMSHKSIDRLDQYNFFVNLGVKNFRIDFYDESKEEVVKILEELKIGK